MKFCSDCAAPVAIKIPADDNRERFVCTACGVVHYQNPNLVVGSIPVWTEGVDAAQEVQILLCKRAIEPRYGYWTLPAGFMENAETSRQAALRETQEEAGANIALHSLFSIVNVPYVDQVHLFYRATLLDLHFKAGQESLEVQLFSESNIPWDDIAFQTVAHTLRFFFDDLKSGRTPENQFLLHELDIEKSATLAILPSEKK